MSHLLAAPSVQWRGSMTAPACPESGAPRAQVPHPSTEGAAQAAPSVATRMAGRRRIPAIVWDAVSEARTCREEASREAEQILSRAREGARTIQATAERRGREEGLASVSEAHVAAVLARDRLLETARSELVDLAFDIAERVIGEVVRRHPEVVAEVAGRALEVSRGKVEVVVRANPSDLCEIQDAEGPLLERMRATERVRFVPDPSLVRGGVVIDTELGRVDASIAAQLSGLRRALDEARGGEGP